MPYKYRKLRGRIVEKYGSQEKFSEVLGLSKNSLSLKLKGKTGFSQADMIKWSQLLDIDISEYGEYFFT